MSNWKPGQQHHTPLTPGSRRNHTGFMRGLAFGVLFGGLIWVSIALIIWAAREMLG